MMDRCKNRGSVLLMVVGLLTMIAMLGGTLVVVTHLDAKSSEALVAKGQADPLASGVVSHVMAKVLIDLNIKSDTAGPYSGGTGAVAWKKYALYPSNEVTPYLYGDRSPAYFSDLGGTGDAVDTDGGGGTDAHLVPADVSNPRGEKYYYAVKITDPSGLLNLNTAGSVADLLSPIAVVNIDAKGSLGLTAYDKLHRERSGNDTLPTMTDWLGSAASRLLSPSLPRKPIAIGDEMYLRWRRAGAMSESGRLYEAIKSYVEGGGLRQCLTTFSCSRSLVRHPTLTYRTRVRPTYLNAASTVVHALDDAALRAHLRSELEYAEAGGSGGSTPSDPVEHIIDDGDTGSGYWASAGWSTYNGLGYSGDFRYANWPANATENYQAKWTFSVTPDSTCEVYVTWHPHSSRTTHAPYTVYDGSTSALSASVNQRLVPPDGWKKLGDFVCSSGTVVVKLTDAGCDDGCIVADACRVVATPPVVTVPPVDAGPEAAHFIANLWASLKTYDEAKSKAFAVEYKEGEVTKKVYGLVSQPFIVEAFAQHQRNTKDSTSGESNDDYYWGCAIRLMNPSAHAISLKDAYKIKGLTPTPADEVIRQDITIAANGGWVVLYDFGKGSGAAAPADPLDAQHLSFRQTNAARWHQVVGLRFLAGKTLRLLRVADGQEIPIDSVSSGAGEDDDLKYAFTKDQIETEPDATDPPPVVKKDIRRDDDRTRGRYSVAEYAQFDSHVLSQSSTGVGTSQISLTEVKQGYNLELLHSPDWAKSPGHLAKLFVVGPRSDGTDLPHALLDFVKTANADPNDRITQDSRARLDLVGRANASAARYPDVPWGALVGEFFEFSPTDPIRTDDPNCAAGTKPGSRIYGRINVNTAPALVLKCLPWPQSVTVGALPSRAVNVDAIVKEIVDYRDKEGLYKTQNRSAVTGILNLRDDSKYGGFLTPGEVAIPLANYVTKTLIPSSDTTSRNDPKYLEARDSLYRAISNVITVNSDVFAINILVQLGKPAKCSWHYVAVIDRSNCFRKDDFPAVLLFSQAR